MYSNLVLSGGALRAIALLGAIKYLEELDYLRHFKQYIGTSAGAIVCFFLIIGYNSEEIKNILANEINFLTDLNFENIPNFIDDYGIDDGSNNKETLEKYLNKKIQVNEITFIEFTKKFGINLVITGSNLTTHETDYFSIDTFPNMNIIDALLITSCIPLIYKPIEYNDHIYVDGGLYNNFAFEYFKNKSNNSNDTLGIYIKTYYSNKNDNFINYFNNIIFSLMEKLTYDNLNETNYNICSIYFEKSSDSDLNFSLENLKLDVDKSIFNEYYDLGYDKFKIYFDNLIKKHDSNTEALI